MLDGSGIRERARTLALMIAVAERLKAPVVTLVTTNTFAGSNPVGYHQIFFYYFSYLLGIFGNLFYL